MNRRIVFIDMNPANEQIPIYQLGICFLGGIAIEKGWDMDIIEYHALQKCGVEYFTEILDNAGCIAISIRNIDNTEGRSPISYLEIMKREVECLSARYSEKIVLGGAGFSILPYEVLDLFDVKYGIVGRGGENFSRMLDWLDAEKKFETFFPEKIVRCESSCDIYQYEKLEYIWKVIPYIEDDRKSLGFDTHIGCYGHCIYCTYPSITQKQRGRRDIREICNFISTAEKMGVQRLQIVDDIFNSDLAYAKYICDGISKVPHNIKISCYLSPNVDEELVQLLKKAGIMEVVMGIDSLSNTVLKKMGKNFTEKEIFTAREMLKKEKISVAYTLIVGSIFETLDTLTETRMNMLKHMPNKITMQYGIRVYPGTRLYYDLRMDGKELELWKPQFAVSDTISKEIIMQFITEMTGLIGERKML